MCVVGRVIRIAKFEIFHFYKKKKKKKKIVLACFMFTSNFISVVCKNIFKKRMKI